MGATNLKKALGSKIGLWAGELQQHEAKIAKIQSLFDSLPSHTARAERLWRVLVCANDVMQEIDPTWSEQ